MAESKLNEIEYRIFGTKKSPREQLDEAMDFFSEKKVVRKIVD
ncbi:MAG: hypothetical protein ABEJ99_00930 [Candidatus Nanohaloarchaea archaeon]